MATRLIIDGETGEQRREEVPAEELEELRLMGERHAAMQKLMARSASEAALNDPDVMRTWGELHSLWDDIEQWLYIGFDSLLKEDHSTTRAIFYSQRTHAGRRGMLEEVMASFHFASLDELKPLKAAIKRVKARSDFRNKITHGFWGWFEDGASGTVELVRMTAEPHLSPDKVQKFTLHDLRRERDSMRSTLEALAEAVKPFQEAKWARWSAELHARLHEDHAQSN
ncbi:hypothetical protein [Pseudorhizobium marinum]|uniref:hypothetical protein n=1 Tax=Pseudorhizobium marinum TaxID=1496690 RepID=UPI00049527A6|nr:hypothetical protein [Pseudorhizobium marinum]